MRRRSARALDGAPPLPHARPGAAGHRRARRLRRLRGVRELSRRAVPLLGALHARSRGRRAGPGRGDRALRRRAHPLRGRRGGAQGPRRRVRVRGAPGPLRGGGLPRGGCDRRRAHARRGHAGLPDEHARRDGALPPLGLVAGEAHLVLQHGEQARSRLGADLARDAVGRLRRLATRAPPGHGRALGELPGVPRQPDHDRARHRRARLPHRVHDAARQLRVVPRAGRTPRAVGAVGRASAPTSVSRRSPIATRTRR